MIPKVGIDIRWVNQSGIGVTIREALSRFPSEKRKSIVLFGDEKIGSSIGYATIAAPFKRYGLGQHFRYGSLLQKSGISLFHMPHFDIPYFSNVPFIATVHDLIHYLFPEFSTRPLTRLYSKIMIGRVASHSKRILVVSQNTKNDLIRHFSAPPEKIKVTYPAIGPSFRPIRLEENRRVKNAYDLPERFLLYVGNLRKSKNTPGLLKAYGEARKKNSSFPDLVLAGQDFMGFAAQPGVRYLGVVPFEDLPSLYGAAEAFVFPSLYEGFGLPPLEAMACGTPVISSNRASLPEVCGEAAVYFDPASEGELTQALIEMVESKARREAGIEKGFQNIKRFSWDRFAQETLTAYEEVLEACL